ncbi:glycine cleavage system aminomethyltransferase GcvT [Paenibacillus sp. KN14-4R]|uniref:glycine cleavage system aminomethyltransferase GcvT n=1 Tax=Paenibacillus sp. KN14-4R TaxID=3445773 RepID=UPI003F9F9E2B
MQLSKTPLFDIYPKYGGKSLPSGSWYLPFLFTNDREEHVFVRQRSGLIDVSHLGKLHVTGSNALPFLQHIVTNDLTRIADGQIQYNLIVDVDGSIIDDTLVFRYSDQHFMLTTNSSRTDEVISHLTDYQLSDPNHFQKEQVQIVNRTQDLAAIAIQGPWAEQILQETTAYQLSSIKKLQFVQGLTIGLIQDVLVSRSGFTGEDGFELYVQDTEAVRLWDYLLEFGKPARIRPVGLLAMESLRIEAGLPLSGREIHKDWSVLDSNLSPWIRFEKRDFVGRDALVQQQSRGTFHQLVGIVMQTPIVPHARSPIYVGDELAGTVTSSSFSPLMNQAIGMAFIETRYAQIHTCVSIHTGKHQVQGTIVKLPFHLPK